MRIALRFFSILIVGLLLFGIVAVGPIDRTPLEEQFYFHQSIQSLDTAIIKQDISDGRLKIGWSEVNITPVKNMPMSGYIPKDSFSGIMDSLYARVLLIDNGQVAVPFISVDLLIFPPTLNDKLQSGLEQIGIDMYYGSASHTHSGPGAWDDTFAGQFIAGKYDEQWIEWLSNSILDAIARAKATSEYASLAYFETDATEYVENRLDRNENIVDGKIRGVIVRKESGKQGILVTYSAHATSINLHSREISSDYPGALSKQLQQEQNYEFGMFMSGMVGSHRFVRLAKEDSEAIKLEANVIVNKIPDVDGLQFRDSLNINRLSFDIPFGPSQMRIAHNWKIRDWLFTRLFKPLSGKLKVIQLGDIIFIGMPGDFSGEIFTRFNLARQAKDAGLHPIITSFNGDFVGYITYSNHYERSDREEVMALNWVGPYSGTYFYELTSLVLQKFSEN